MPDFVTDLFTYALSISAMLLGLVWLAVGVWTYRDMRAHSRSLAWAIVALILVLGLPAVGLVLYLLLRPRETLVEAYDRALEQEALLQQIEEPLACPGCSRRVSEAWIVCPDCRTKLRQPCPSCSRPLDLRWAICPYCAYQYPASPLTEAQSDSPVTLGMISKRAAESGAD